MIQTNESLEKRKMKTAGIGITEFAAFKPKNAFNFGKQ